MNNALSLMLKKYHCHQLRDYENALKEIIQEITLLGLWRAKFFDKAAFYGGTALRILYGLDRFSEDLDFTLLTAISDFKLDKYNVAIKEELSSFGFKVVVDTKQKNVDTAIESAFIKAETRQQLILIEAPVSLVASIPKMQTLKVKVEVDTSPPPHINTEVKTLLHPIPFSVKTVSQPDLFAGKLHAILCRKWKNRIKGRDWYDFYWFIAHNIMLNREALRQRLIQTHIWHEKKDLTASDIKKLLLAKIEQVDFKAAKQDVLPFIKDKQALALWGPQFFTALVEKIHYS